MNVIQSVCVTSTVVVPDEELSRYISVSESPQRRKVLRALPGPRPEDGK
jgi:hypothetical protein